MDMIFDLFAQGLGVIISLGLLAIVIGISYVAWILLGSGNKNNHW
jgi:hypothetical protein